MFIEIDEKIIENERELKETINQLQKMIDRFHSIYTNPENYDFLGKEIILDMRNNNSKLCDIRDYLIFKYEDSRKKHMLI